MTVLLVATPLSLAAQTAPPPPPPEAARAVPRYSIEDFLATTGYFGASWSPDRSKLLVSHNGTGIYNAYAVRVAGGAPVPLTTSTTDAVRVVSYFPADERFLYQSDRGGNELTHLYVQSPDGSVKDLTPGDSLKAAFLQWAPDDRSFYVQTNERDPRFFDLYEYQVDGYARTMIYRNEQGLDPVAVSRDRRWVALLKPRTTNDSDVWLLDVRSGALRNLTEHTGNVSNTPVGFDPAGLALYFMSDAGSEFAYLVRHDLATAARDTVVKPNWDVMYADFSKHGRYMAVGVNADARTDVTVYDAATMKPVRLPTLPAGNITGVSFSPDEERIAFYASDSRHPSDLFVAELGGSEARRLTRAISPKIDPDNLVDARVTRFKSYDGVDVPGLLYVPRDADSSARGPALVMVHGGPGGQARVGYNALVQYLVNHGYTVFDINNRGSSGYGKTFFAMDDRKHGEADLGDVVASKGMLAGTGVVDSARIGIIGGSYGGYMVLAALTLRPTAFAAGVDLFGPANWMRTLESIPPWWASFKEALYSEMGDPATDRERLTRISPLFHADRIQRPLMVLQGANDPRVLQRESDEIVAAARKNGVPVEYLVFPDEGHGFVKKANQARGYRAVLDFLDQHIGRGRPKATS
ncbi:MAG TPA: prolyl oligopeptidase family serine peptidase [Gemmatimonadaceae bacterium]|nr:prolyl oligopeptidase family serine peptidase [Gemmatimonadaceae bacterium]